MKTLCKILFVASLLLIMTACEEFVDPENQTSGGSTVQYSGEYSITVNDALAENIGAHEDDDDYSTDYNTENRIVLSDGSITIGGTGILVDGNIITIISGGDYYVTGTLSDGRLIIECQESETVKLILDNVDITSSVNAPISVNSAKKTIIFLADNSVNYITDPGAYVFDNSEEDEPNAALFSKDDLSITGSGSLIIDANYNDGIATKDGLIINSGIINIEAKDDGIRGKDYLVIKSGSININCGGDGLKSDNDEYTDRGYILVEDGEISVTSGTDGFDASTDVLISSGAINIISGGGSGSYAGAYSKKGIKSNKWLVLDSGNFSINSADDAIHSNCSIVINNGDFTIASRDDAVHADTSLVISGGSLNITECEEGIESNLIAIEDGNINIDADDDCINSTAGNDVEGDDKSCTYIYGGSMTLTTRGGDGIDSNGSLVMTGGNVIIHGPSSSPEVILDYNGSFNISGGFMIGSGSSSHMMQAPGSSSPQYSLKIMFRSSKTSSTIFHIEDSSGNEVVTFQPVHRYYSILFSSSALVNGGSYNIYIGGSSTGENINGVYSGGTYSGGTKSSSFTISGSVTSLTI